MIAGHTRGELLRSYRPLACFCTEQQELRLGRTAAYLDIVLSPRIRTLAVTQHNCDLTAAAVDLSRGELVDYANGGGAAIQISVE